MDIRMRSNGYERHGFPTASLYLLRRPNKVPVDKQCKQYNQSKHADLSDLIRHMLFVS